MKSQFADPYTRLQIQNEINNLQAQANGKIVQIHDAINSINPNLYVAKIQIQEVIEQLRRNGHNFMDSFYKYFEDFNSLISSLDYTQNIAFINLSGIFVILVTIISIIFIFYGNIILDYLNLEQRYPKIAKFIILRRKFQQYYLLWDIFIITIVSIVMFIMNLTLFI
jgi:ABC-type multidrug transport system permease subunit